jgi:hypothetical protein
LRKPAALRAGVCVLLALALGGQVAWAIGTFRFTPAEDWTLAGRAIDAAFPKSTRIDFKRYAKYLRQTLPDAEARSADYDEAQFAAGGLIVADAGNKWAEGDRFVPPSNVDRVVQWVIPGTIRDIDLTFRIRESRGLANPPAPLIDGNAKTGIDATTADLALRCEPAPGSRALVLLFNRPVDSDFLSVQSSASQPLFAGNAVVLPLSGSAPTDIRLRAAKGSKTQIVEAFVTQ